MADAQVLVDSIRAFLERGEKAPMEELRALADDLAEVGRAADNRLRRCEDYIRRGLLGEAVHLAELEPPLLDVLMILDFPGRDRWDEVTRSSGLALAPAVNQLRAGTVNQIYEPWRRIEPLLREHRRLALTRAPLGERLAVLRQLAEVDAGNPLWMDDLRGYEEAWQEELLGQADEAHRAKDGRALSAVMSQLQVTAWSHPPAGVVMQELQRKLEDATVAQARTVLPGIVRDLNRALQSNDLHLAMNLRGQLDLELTRVVLPASDPLRGQIDQARSRIDESIQEQNVQAAFATDLAAFVALLESPSLREERLTDAYARLVKQRRPIPATVQKRYRQVRDRFKAEAEAKANYWRQVVNGTVLAVAAPLVAGIVIVVIYVVWKIVHAP